VTVETVEACLALADGVIVGTSLKVDGAIAKPLDQDRVRRMVDRVRALRA
jgi:hypothetical protein